MSFRLAILCLIISALFFSAATYSDTQIGLFNKSEKNETTPNIITSKEKTPNNQSLYSKLDLKTGVSLNVNVAPQSSEKPIKDTTNPIDAHVTDNIDKKLSNAINEIKNLRVTLVDLQKSNAASKKSHMHLNKRLSEQSQWFENVLWLIGFLFSFVSIGFSFQLHSKAKTAFDSIGLAADTVRSQMDKLDFIEKDVIKYRKDIETGTAKLEYLEKLSSKIDLDIASLVKSEGTIVRYNFKVMEAETNYPEYSKLNLNTHEQGESLLDNKDFKIFSSSIKFVLNALENQKIELKKHLDFLKKYERNGVKSELIATIREQLFRILWLQGLGHRKVWELDYSIIVFKDALNFASNKNEVGVIHFNLACYYTLLKQFGPASRNLSKAIQFVPSLAKEAKRDNDLSTLERDSKTLWDNAMMVLDED